MRFYVGCHQPSDAQHFARSFVSINRLRNRRSAFRRRVERFDYTQPPMKFATL